MNIGTNIPMRGDGGGVSACLGKSRGNEAAPAESNDGKLVAALALQEVDGGICINSELAGQVLGRGVLAKPRPESIVPLIRCNER